MWTNTFVMVEWLFFFSLLFAYLVIRIVISCVVMSIIYNYLEFLDLNLSLLHSYLTQNKEVSLASQHCQQSFRYLILSPYIWYIPKYIVWCVYVIIYSPGVTYISTIFCNLSMSIDYFLCYCTTGECFCKTLIGVEYIR